MAVESVVLKVGGMMCDNCVGHVTKALTGLDGVEEASVDLAAGAATVRYDSDKVSTDAMRSAIEDAGYDAA